MFDKIFKIVVVIILAFMAYTLHTYTINTRYSYSVLNDAIVERETGNLYVPAKSLSNDTRVFLKSLSKSK